MSPEYSSEPGLYSYIRRPYQKEVLDEIGNSDNEKIVIVSATQMMKTIVLMIAEAYKMAKRPGPILHVMDTIINCTKYSRERLDSMIRDNNFLTSIVQEVKPKKADTILMKKFVNGILKLVGANSPSGLIFTTIKDLLLDEVDSYRISTGEMGDPVELAIKRTTEFEDRQIIIASSPGNEITSRIKAEWDQSDQRYFYVPCPSCDEYQKLEWGGKDKDFGIKWENNDPTTAYYLCAKCKEKIYNRQKYWMNSHGEWKKTFPEVINHPGFHINRLYSPSSTTSWDKLVKDFLIAQRFSKMGDNERLQVHVNTVLAEWWTPKYNIPKNEKLLSRIENYFSTANPNIAGKVCYITAFVDVQPTWLELKVKGWGIGEESWLLERKIIEGNTGHDYVWNELDRQLIKPFPHPLGLNLYISAIGVDTGFNSDKAYAFVKDRLVRKLNNGVVQKFFATKGWNSPWKPITDYKPRMNNKGGIPLYMIGTDSAKEVIYNRLSIDNEEQSAPGYMHFNLYADPDYFQGLLSEALEIDRVTKIPKWVKVFERNEPLDCEVGNLFLLRLTRANLLKIMENLTAIAEKQKEGTLFDKKQNDNYQRPSTNWAVDGWKK